jgi:hypothetical protein
MDQMKNLVSTTTETNVKIAQEKHQIFQIEYNKKENSFMNATEYVKFIKSVEGLIRHSKEYAAYIAYLKSDVGLKSCCIFGNIDDSVAKIEMHHGPIFTLYDYVEITLTHLFKNKENINSSNVAYNVLQDHYDNLIQVVMLCEAAHTAVHNFKGDKKFFVSIDSAWGDITEYLKKYSDGLNVTHVQKLKQYMTNYTLFKNTDEKESNRTMIFKEELKQWKINL